MCSTDAYERINPTENDDASGGGGRPLSQNSTEDVLVSLWLTLNFVDPWLQSFKKNNLHQITIHCDKMS